jgi:preprotein translocase subunit SecY
MNLRIFQPLIDILPEVEAPKEKPVLKERMKWTIVGLLLFAVLGVVMPIGIAETSQTGFLANLQLITASKIGTLATLGIGPIVMSSIILQLLNGAKILNLNLQNPEEKKLFQGVQKLLAIAFCFFEAVIYVSSGFVPALPGFANLFLLVIQLALGGLILIYLDEVISKYGIGSGVGLFIAAGVSFTIIWQAFSWVTATGTGTFIGLVPQLLQGIIVGDIAETAIYPLIFTVVVFLLVVYCESMKLEVPLTLGKIRGYGARYPLKFFYVSNIPVIFAAALFANVQLWGVAMDGMGLPLLGSFENNQAVSGIAYYLQAPYGALSTPTQAMITFGSLDAMLNILVYAAAMIIFCIVFGKFWVEMSGMGAKSISGQLQTVGLHIPGFRRDPRVIEMVLERYIPMITLIGSAAVGALAVLADLTGALGTGTGILLTVGILYRMYEELASQQAFEMMPGLKAFLGG